ncbi:hypothetical protein B0A50_04564 [Salinomyces thailandicus]|uniref:Uncharacterized protein n=1 Tax=Salinomyces thailandicus TaxID=706561 RepID=A0A4U0TXV5_9PEZI|nr:hypothetical protein B0A50_04564 [Salinomyces thailandica]
MENQSLSTAGFVRNYGRHEHTPNTRQPSKLTTGLTGVVFQVQMTPPETPVSSHDNDALLPGRALFHNYLRALYHFDPSAALPRNNGDESLLTTTAIKPGDLILVHSVHANGWADGTVLTTGERGWLPTNYCEAYDHPYLRNLLNAMTQLWDLLGANEDANFSNFIRQDYIRGLIAGVRYILEHADCLHRNAALVQQYTGIRRMRKGLLADLSSLVQIARSLQETISEPFAGELIHYLLDDLMAKAFKVVTRAVGFVDMWSKETTEVRLNVRNRDSTHLPMTPPSNYDDLTIDIDASRQEVDTDPVDSAKCLPAAEFEEQRGQAVAGAQSEARRLDHGEQSSIARYSKRQSSLAHRLSLTKAERNPCSALASEQLAHVHDVCISNIGAFIGHHLHARPASELVETTERLVNACEAMLIIVDDVYAHDVRRSASVRQARLNFQATLGDLIKATKEVFSFSDLEEGEVVVLRDQSDHLITVGTSLIRSSGECVAKTRGLIEQMGDFELENRPRGMRGADQPAIEPPQGLAQVQERSLRPKSTSTEKRFSRKTLPPPPPICKRSSIVTDTFDFALDSPDDAPVAGVPTTVPFAGSLASNALSPRRGSAAMLPEPVTINGATLRHCRSSRLVNGSSPARQDSVGISIAGSADTYRSSTRNSAITAVSEVSTRATTPEKSNEPASSDDALLSSFNSISSMRSGNTDVELDAETQLLQKTYASELTFSKDGHVSGGSLPALVEKLTTHDSTPDPQFVSAFYITFRLFTTPRELAQALVARFDYIGDNRAVGMPVKLRICNIFKGWLETHWNAEADKDALGEIRYFALHTLKPHLPSAGERLVDLTRKVSTVYRTGTIQGPLVSGVGKTSLSIGLSQDSSKAIPEPVVTRSQLQALRTATSGGHQCSVTELDPVEVARQLALITSAIFCEIQADELLEWNKKGTKSEQNVRRMCALNNDIAHVVADTILEPDDARKRALIIKHWAKVAEACLELNNYDSLMAIMCTLNSSVVQRLKRTWELVSKKTKVRMEEMNAVIDIEKNHASLRKRLESPFAPCIPFLGIYLTDLTFLDVGNSKKRDLPGAASGQPTSVINFDKYMRMAKVVTHLQNFQVPYRLQPVQEMQAWLDAYLQRMRAMQDEMIVHFHRRSLMVEPKRERLPRMADGKKSGDAGSGEERPKTATGKERFETFLRNNSFGFKVHDMPLPVVPNAEKHG